VTTSKESVVERYEHRLRLYRGLHSQMGRIAAIYNGNVTVPLPDMDRNESSSVPNLLAVGVDQTAGRIASVIPTPSFSSMRPGVRKYDRRAADAGRVIQGWWQLDRVPNQLKKRARHLISYAMAPNMMRWDKKNNRPHWEWRDPMSTYPSPDMIPGSVSPTDCIFAYKRSATYLRQAGYGNAVSTLTDNYTTHGDTEILLVEYVDAEETILVAAGWKTAYEQATYNSGQGLVAVELERYPNPIGLCPVTVPTRIGLNGPQGQFDTMVPMYYTQARLMALEIIAIEKDIFPDTYLESRQGEVGRFLDGPHDGRTGKVNIVSGGAIRNIQSQPGYMTPQAINRLEENQRQTAGIPNEFSGESTSGIRTGRRGDAVLSATIDFPIAEAQELFAYALEREDEIAAALAKQFDGKNERVIPVGTSNSNKVVRYVADETFETVEHVVSYPITGVDINTLNVQIGTLLGSGMMSIETAQVLSPLISDPEGERDRIVAQSVNQALLAGWLQKVTTGEVPLTAAAKVAKWVGTDKMELPEAIEKATKEAAAEAEAQQAGAPQTPDGMAADPTLAGMTGGVPSAATTANDGMKGLSQMLGNLRRPNMSIRPMANVQQGGV